MSGLLDISREARARAEVFSRHLAVWREVARHHARHADVETCAPAILAAMFDRAEGVPHGYRLHSTPIAATVLLNAVNWRWHVADGSAEGRGLYTLWAWRFGIPVEQAHAELWGTINAMPAAPAKRRRRKLA